jgi:hypothetical protein
MLCGDAAPVAVDADGDAEPGRGGNHCRALIVPLRLDRGSIAVAKRGARGERDGRGGDHRDLADRFRIHLDSFSGWLNCCFAWAVKQPDGSRARAGLVSRYLSTARRHRLSGACQMAPIICHAQFQISDWNPIQAGAEATQN